MTWTPNQPDFDQLVKELLALKASNEELTERVTRLEDRLENLKEDLDYDRGYASPGWS